MIDGNIEYATLYSGLFPECQSKIGLDDALHRNLNGITMDERLNRIATLAYDTEAGNKYADGAPHVKRGALRQFYGLVEQVFDNAKKHTQTSSVLDVGVGEMLDARCEDFSGIIVTQGSLFQLIGSILSMKNTFAVIAKKHSI
ncbi:MAG: hypothetical protein Q7T96_19230 [Methylobacter sp.]|nr:hypothetical protein [Methylobacter sp.]